MRFNINILPYKSTKKINDNVLSSYYQVLNTVTIQTWMDGWMDRWTDGWVDGWMVGGQMDGGWTGGWMDGWMEKKS
jgi:hypothetical protein